MSRAHILDLRWTDLINEFRSSVLIHAQFCDHRGISIHAYRNNLYGTRTSRPSPQSKRPSLDHSPQLLPVTILPEFVPPTGATQAGLELILSNGRRIAVAPGFDPETLRRLLSVGAGRCSD